MPHGLDRIVVIGTTSAGKTTLARQLSERLGAPHVELDALHWEPNWTPAVPELFRERVAQATLPSAWVADGNYSAVRDIVWTRATTLVWLDYSMAVITWRLPWRTLIRIARREELWNGNRETMRGVFLSRDSLLVWVFQTHWKQRRTFPNGLRQPEYAHLDVVHLRSPRATRHWLSSLEMPGASR